MNVVIKALLIIIGLIIIFSFLQFVISIFPPKFTSSRTPTDLGMAYEDVSFMTNDGIKLAGWLVKTKKSDPVIIVGHGYPFDKGNILPLARFLHPRYNLLYIDFRSFGQSGGRMTTAGFRETEDVHAATKFLKKQGYKPPFGALGFSMSASAFLMAQDTSIGAIVAESPYASLDEVLNDVYWIFPGPTKWPLVELTKLYGDWFLGINSKDKSPIKAIKQTSTPTLIIHGKADSQISLRHAIMLKEEASDSVQFWIVPGADHGQVQALHPTKYRNKVLEFYKRTLKK